MEIRAWQRGQEGGSGWVFVPLASLGQPPALLDSFPEGTGLQGTHMPE